MARRAHALEAEAAVATLGRAIEAQPNLFEAQFELGDGLKALGRFDAAEAAYRRAAAIRLGRMALAIRREVLVPGDPALANSLFNHSFQLLLTLDWPKAEPLLDEALTICEDAFAAYPRHPSRVTTAKRLGTAALMRGDRAKAEAMIARYPDDLDLGKLKREALAGHFLIKANSGAAGPEAQTGRVARGRALNSYCSNTLLKAPMPSIDTSIVLLGSFIEPTPTEVPQAITSPG